MSRIIELAQYDTLTNLRNKVSASIAANNPDETNRTIGMVQGYLIGLHAAGEIDINDVKTLEAETLANVQFLMNARKACNAY